MALLNTPTAFGLKVAKMEADRKKKGEDEGEGEAGGHQPG